MHPDPPAGAGERETEGTPDSTGGAGDEHGPAVVRVLRR
jgi:hypothetical protein